MEPKIENSLNMAVEDVDDLEWEVRNENTPVSIHMMAGCFAGILEHTSMLPFDNIKTHSQILKENNTIKIGKLIYNNGGLLKLWRGFSVIASGCPIAHSAYFSIYELSKKFLGITNEKVQPLLFATTGAFASVAHDTIITPFDVVKQRKQLLKTKTSLQILKEIMQKEGLFELYRSLPVTIFMNIPWTMSLVTINEVMKRTIYQDQDKHTFFSLLLCSGVASTSASIFTIPLDNIKTRLQTQKCFYDECFFQQQCLKSVGESDQDFAKKSKEFFKQKLFSYKAHEQQPIQHLQHSHQSSHTTGLGKGKQRFKFWKALKNLKCKSIDNIKYANIRDTVKIIYAEEGMRGFFKGVTPRVIGSAPAAAISWATYETVKKFLTKNISTNL